MRPKSPAHCRLHYHQLALAKPSTQYCDDFGFRKRNLMKIRLGIARALSSSFTYGNILRWKNETVVIVFITRLNGMEPIIGGRMAGYRHEAWMDDRLGSLERGENPTVILKMKSGYAVLGDYQYLPGYCVLLGFPRAESLNGLSLGDRSRFMRDMTLVGDAVIAVCKPLRLNYSVLMNFESFLHAHIQARYNWEPDEYRTGPVWNYPREQMYDEQYFCAGKKYRALQAEIRAALEQRLETIGYWEDGLA